MKLSHVVYKVENLDAAVTQYRKDGFDVEYGKEKKPYNAVIYFADGSYLELLYKTGMPAIALKLLSLFGKKAFAHRLTTWENSEEGLIGVALECKEDQLDDAKKILREAGQNYFQVKSMRPDTKGRELRFTGIMPDEMKIPYFGTCDTDLTRKDFVHPNGIKGFKNISFGTKEELLPLIKRLCNDTRVSLFVGDGVKELEYEYEI